MLCDTLYNIGWSLFQYYINTVICYKRGLVNLFDITKNVTLHDQKWAALIRKIHCKWLHFLFSGGMCLWVGVLCYDYGVKRFLQNCTGCHKKRGI